MQRLQTRTNAHELYSLSLSRARFDSIRFDSTILSRVFSRKITIRFNQQRKGRTQEKMNGKMIALNNTLSFKRSVSNATNAKEIKRGNGSTCERRIAKSLVGKKGMIVSKGRKGISDIIGEEIEGLEKQKKVQKSKRQREEGQKVAKEFNERVAQGKQIPNGFLKILNVNELEDGKKQIKAVELANGAFCVVKVGDLIYVCDCNSTAYKYPLIDGEVFSGPSGAAIRSGFDGTSYDLTTGKVIEWCPQDTLPRKLLGKLKEKENPIDLGVYPVMVDENGDIYACFI